MVKNPILSKLYIPACIVLEESEDCQLSNKGTWFTVTDVLTNWSKFSIANFSNLGVCLICERNLLPFFIFVTKWKINGIKYLACPIIYGWYRFCLHLKFTDVINYTLVYCTTSKYYVPCVCKRLLKNCLNLMQICQVHSSRTWTDVMETKLKLI